MQNGNLAEAHLRALIDVAAVAAGAHRLEEVLELAAERSLDALGAASLAISRWDVEAGVVRTLVNVGDLAPGEERFPENETYSVEDFPALSRVIREGSISLAAVDDPRTDPAHRDLLRRLGKESSLSVPMTLGGQPWGELEVMTAPGRPRLTKDDETFLRAIGDQLVGAIHRAELFAEIERLAFTDSLTGVATRRAVETALEEACADPPRPGSPAVVLCDIDDLKGVNDTGGHEAGDRALVAAAEALVEAAKEHEDAVVGRFGGDEFCVLLPSGTAEEARQVALEAVRRLDAVEGERISCGVAGRSIDACEPSALLRAADAAQYAAKRSDVVDVVVNGADAAPDSYLPADGEYRAFRASGSETRFRRELLELLEDASGASADERLARVRERLERGD